MNPPKGKFFAKAIDQNNKPIGNKDLRIEATNSDGRMTTVWVKTDKDGIFALPNTFIGQMITTPKSLSGEMVPTKAEKDVVFQIDTSTQTRQIMPRGPFSGRS